MKVYKNFLPNHILIKSLIYCYLPIPTISCLYLHDRRVAIKVVAILVVVARDRNEVAAVRQRLIDLAVELRFLVEAWALELVVLGKAARQPRLGAERGELARLDHREAAMIVEVAKRHREAHASLVARRQRTIVDRSASGRSSWRIDVGHAQVDVDLLDQLGVDLLVGENRIIAAVVERDAVEGQADAVAVEAANAQIAARAAERIGVGEVDAGDQVDCVEHGLARRLAPDQLLRDDALGLGRIGRDDTANAIVRARAGDDNRLFFKVDRTRRLRHGGGWQDDGRCRTQQNQFLHG